MMGTLVGAYVGEFLMQECLAFTTGGFIYFAVNGLLQELKEVKSSVALVVCLLFMGFGMYFMYVFALFE